MRQNWFDSSIESHVRKKGRAIRAEARRNSSSEGRRLNSVIRSNRSLIGNIAILKIFVFIEQFGIDDTFFGFEVSKITLNLIIFLSNDGSINTIR